MVNPALHVPTVGSNQIMYRLQQTFVSSVRVVAELDNDLLFKWLCIKFCQQFARDDLLC